MGRLLCGVLALALAMPACRAEDKPAKADDYQALKKEFDAAKKTIQEKIQAKAKELQAEFDKAKTDEAKKEVIEKFRAFQVEQYSKFGQRFLDFAEKNPKSPDAYDALVQALGLSGGPTAKTGLWKKAMAAIQKDHVKNEKIGQLIGRLGDTEDKTTLALLEAIAKNNPNAETRAKAEKILSLSVGHKAPEATSEDLNGKKVQLSDYKGKVVVLDIWATWCGPCRRMIPHERELVKRLKGKPFVLISVSADAKKETLTKFLGETPMPWTHWWTGQKGSVLKTFDVQFFPTIYVLDAKGVIRYKNVRGKEMDEAVEKLLKEMGVKVEPAAEKKEPAKEKKDK
jgi:thiol-disulfide isomerase/thioredoxin